MALTYNERMDQLVSTLCRHGEGLDRIAEITALDPADVRHRALASGSLDISKERDIIDISDKPAPVMTTPRWRARATCEGVAQAIGVSVTAIRSDQRTRRVCHARWIVFDDLYRLGWSLTQIGKFMGRDHTTVLYGIKALHYIRTGEVSQTITHDGVVPQALVRERTEYIEPGPHWADWKTY